MPAPNPSRDTLKHCTRSSWDIPAPPRPSPMHQRRTARLEIIAGLLGGERRAARAPSKVSPCRGWQMKLNRRYGAAAARRSNAVHAVAVRDDHVVDTRID